MLFLGLAGYSGPLSLGYPWSTQFSGMPPCTADRWICLSFRVGEVAGCLTLPSGLEDVRKALKMNGIKWNSPSLCNSHCYSEPTPADVGVRAILSIYPGGFLVH